MPLSLIIPNAVSEYFINDNENAEKGNYILGVGRFTEQKNFPLLIKAFSKISDSYPDLKLIICGDGKLRQTYVDLISTLGLDGRVELPGQIKDIRSVMLKAKIFVLSSDYEGIPNALIEAMACGAPCISTDCLGGGARLLIKDGYNGLIVPPDDTDRLAQALSYIMENDDFSNHISENAKKISDDFSPENIYSQWENFINTVSKNNICSRRT